MLARNASAVLAVLFVLVVLTMAPGAVRAQKGPALPELLKLAGDYLTQYSERLGVVAAEEEYLQYETSSGNVTTPRRVNTHVVWLGRGDGGIDGFRDVVGLDSVPIRPKDDRLFALFGEPSEASLSRAKQLTEDSVRQYLDLNLHALDQPTLALEYLRLENQQRSTFKLESVKSMNGAQVAVVTFNEKGAERLIPSVENAAAVGRFWIDAASGIVRQTQLGLGGKWSNLHVTVKYVSDPASGLWLPSDMVQHVDVSRGVSSAVNNMGAGGYNTRFIVDGHATYSKYRRIPLDLTKLR
jgi:hypothetical protein